jgi:hypothetical protein
MLGHCEADTRMGVRGGGGEFPKRLELQRTSTHRGGGGVNASAPLHSTLLSPPSPATNPRTSTR